MFRHVSLIKLQDTSTMPAIFEELAKLPGIIPALRDYRVGPDAALADDNFDFAVVADFDDVAGYESYRDNEEHRPYRTGNLRDFPSLYQAYTSGKLAGWRRHLISTKEKEGPCKTCTVHFITNEPAKLAQMERAYQQYVVPLQLAEARAAAPGA